MGFLDLPLEVRFMIYKLVFASTTITFGKPDELKHLRSRDPLRFMRTCRSVFEETSAFLPGDALFDFVGACRFVTFMMSLDETFVRRIRRVSIAAQGLHRPLESEGRRTYIERILPLIKGLRLDCLTLRYLNPDQSHLFHGINGDYEIEQLLVASNGWKELIYYVPSFNAPWDHMHSDTCIRPTPWGHNSIRTERPSQWNRTLSARDGAESGAGVTVYLVQTKETLDEAGRPLVSSNYKQLRQSIGDTSFHEVDIVPKPPRVRRPRKKRVAPPEDCAHNGFKDVGFMIIARRGRQVSYVQDGSGLESNMKSILSHTSWWDLLCIRSLVASRTELEKLDAFWWEILSGW